MVLKLLLLWSMALVASAQIDMNQEGCGKTKYCLFKPKGCVPNLDCTMAAILWVSGANQLTVQLSATTLQPHPILQYVAIGFSKDQIMGNDAVSECVVSPSSHEFSIPEVYLSYNIKEGKGNSRVFLSSTDRNATFKDVRGNVEESRFSCQFTQTIVPQIPDQNNTIWDLNQDLFIFVATGRSDANEIMVHDLNRNSFFYPIISPEAVNPTSFAAKKYDLPKEFDEHEEHQEHEGHMHHPGDHKMNGIVRNCVNSFMMLVFVYLVCLY